MLDKLTIDMFAARLGETFRLQVEPERMLDLELVQVTPLKGQAGPSGREPFSIVFRGPSNAVAPQRIYPLAHDTMGTHELFIVPIGPDQRGMLYEAIFS
jgi:hypothetical protein